jgi:hypothetical protein
MVTVKGKHHRGAQINPSGEASVCMVLDCGRTALYRTPSSAGTKRGFCDRHKALAVGTHQIADRQAVRLAGWLDDEH